MPKPIQPDSKTSHSSWVRGDLPPINGAAGTRKQSTLPHSRDSLQISEETSSFTEIVSTSYQKCWTMLCSLYTFSLSLIWKKKPPITPEATSLKPTPNLVNDDKDEVSYDAQEGEDTPNLVNDDENEVFYDAKDTEDIPRVSQPTPPPTRVSKDAPLTDQENLQDRFMTAFLSTMVSADSNRHILFGFYLMNHVFKDPESCHFNELTGQFTLNFSEEKIISISKIPAEHSPVSTPSLENLKGKNLHIARQIKGKIINADSGENSTSIIVFESGALTLKWARGYMQAPLLEMKAALKNADILGMKGKALGIEGWTWINAQDFVNTLTLNGLN